MNAKRIQDLCDRPAVVDVWKLPGQLSAGQEGEWWQKTAVGRAAMATACSVSPSLHEDLTASPNASIHVCREGINRAMDCFHRSDRVVAPNGKSHFLIADGTGTGKGFQAMLTAAMLAEKTQKPSLVVTRPDLVKALLRDAALLGVPAEQSGVKVTGYDRLLAEEEEWLKSGKTYGLVALDEAHDVPRSPALRRFIDEAPTANILYLSATPYVGRGEAVYFLSRLCGKSEKEMEQVLGSNLHATVQGIEALNRQLYDRGALIRREFPFWGQMGQLLVHAPSHRYREEESRVQAAYRQRFREVESDQEILATQQRFDREIRALSDEALIDHACEEITKKVRAGRKVIFYGSDSTVTSLVNERTSLERRYQGLLGGLEEKLAQRGIATARLSDDSTRSADGVGDLILRNSMEANRFIDSPILKANGEPILTPEGEKLVCSECDVILLPHSQSAGWSQFCQHHVLGKPVTVISSMPEQADELQQQEGRVSRVSSCGPAEAKVISLYSLADQERLQKIVQGNAFLKSIGSLWVRAHDRMLDRYHQAGREACERAASEREAPNPEPDRHQDIPQSSVLGPSMVTRPGIVSAIANRSWIAAKQKRGHGMAMENVERA